MRCAAISGALLLIEGRRFECDDDALLADLLEAVAVLAGFHHCPSQHGAKRSLFGYFAPQMGSASPSLLPYIHNLVFFFTYGKCDIY
jgi:hypothetical protein